MVEESRQAEKPWRTRRFQWAEREETLKRGCQTSELTHIRVPDFTCRSHTQSLSFHPHDNVTTNAYQEMLGTQHLTYLFDTLFHLILTILP